MLAFQLVADALDVHADAQVTLRTPETPRAFLLGVEEARKQTITKIEASLDWTAAAPA